MSERKKQQETIVAAEHADLKEVMATPAGRRVMHRLLRRAGIYQCSFNGQSNSTIFNEGGRNQGLMLLADIQIAAPGSYLTMLKENGNG